jgi:hypothetical protein
MNLSLKEIIQKRHSYTKGFASTVRYEFLQKDFSRDIVQIALHVYSE